ncbi:MAG TPA: hypothetical protein VM187_19195, partial [Niastella sp.]|nr:hypothetical protein [Niastella sp.]
MLSLFSRPGAPLFYEIATQHHIATWALQYMMKNMKIMAHGAITVNTGSFGVGTVFPNFNYSKPLPVGVLHDRPTAGNQL